MTAPSYQTVRLARGRHSSWHAGVCVMELASMLAHEAFSDRAGSISPTMAPSYAPTTMGSTTSAGRTSIAQLAELDTHNLSGWLLSACTRRKTEMSDVERTVIAQANVTMDGMTAGPNGDLSWLIEHAVAPQMSAYAEGSGAGRARR
jgi:hypothetical protein